MEKISRDTDGNTIKVTATGKGATIKLYLSKEGRWRLIGNVDYVNRILKVRRKKDKHLHYKTGSYGFNYHILSHAKHFDHVEVTDEDGTYKHTVRYLLNEGTFLYFRENGFEKQLFVTLDKLRQPETIIEQAKLEL